MTVMLVHQQEEGGAQSGLQDWFKAKDETITTLYTQPRTTRT